MSSKEVVISDKKDRQVNCAGHTFESGAGTGMEFISPIEAFDQLLQGTILFTDIILVGKTDDSLAENDIPVGMLIVCHDRIVIRSQTVLSLIGSSAMPGVRKIPIQPRSNDCGAGFDVIEHSLMGKMNSEQSLQNFPGLTGRQDDVHEMTQNQTNGMVRGLD